MGLSQRCAAFALMGLASTVASAANWQSVDTVEADGIHFFVDRASLVKNGPFTKVWVKANADRVQRYSTPDGPRFYRSAISQYLFKCGAGQVAIAQSVTYSDIDGGGTPIDNIKYPTPEHDLAETVPGSVGDGLLKFVCAR
ncbi:surface-adhesin E family protein [Burkholderia gladioli]|uniref:surface-adhesin E family protein n=1 Tax=Burkholderia gladioli TaxID=28095 RepID=UPI0016410B5F|nr:surface-adhesin E family protein [Burkholderia gladioli]